MLLVDSVMTAMAFAASLQRRVLTGETDRQKHRRYVEELNRGRE